MTGDGFADIQTLLSALANGRMVVLVDDEERENEGDLLIAANFITPAAINFMSQHGRGLICLTLTGAHCDKLNLPPMTADNRTSYATNFTVSIEAAHGVTTGISAQDRATTVLAAANPNAVSTDVVSPGHIFPLRAAAGGVLVRAGHTEAGCDLAGMAGLFPAAVICEIMNEDGSMARLAELQEFAKCHNLPLGTIKSLIAHRLETEQLIVREHEGVVQTAFGEFRQTTYRDTIDNRLHIALHRGDIRPDTPVVTRVVINPSPLDGVLTAFSSPSWGTARALQYIASIDSPGVVVLLEVGHLQEEKVLRQIGVAPSPPLPVAASLPQHGLGAQILRDLEVGKIILLSGRIRLPSIEGFGLAIEEIIEP